MLEKDSFNAPHQHALSRSTVHGQKIASFGGGGCNNFQPNPVTSNWTLLAPQFSFVERIMSFAPKVVGASNRIRFNYWSGLHQLNRAEGHALTLWAAFEGAFQLANNSNASAATRGAALQARIELVGATNEVVRLQSNTLSSMGSLGTLMEAQQRWIPFMISNYDTALAKLLKLQELPPQAMLQPGFLGTERVFALSPPASVEAAEPFVLTAIALTAEPVQICAVFAQRLGPSTAPMFLTDPMPLVTAGRQVYRLEFPLALTQSDFQYYVNCTGASSSVWTWPVDGVNNPFTVVVV